MNYSCRAIVFFDENISVWDKFSLVPFGNLIDSINENIIAIPEIKSNAGMFLLVTISFSIMFGMVLPFTFIKKPNYKKIFIFSTFILEILQFLLFVFVGNGNIIGGIFDTGAFILTPIFLLLGIKINMYINNIGGQYND